MERHLPSYAGNLPDIVLNHVLQSACGRYGTTRDYVEQTVNALRSHAMPDKNLEARLKRCAKDCPGGYRAELTLLVCHRVGIRKAIASRHAPISSTKPPSQPKWSTV